VVGHEAFPEVHGVAATPDDFSVESLLAELMAAAARIPRRPVIVPRGSAGSSKGWRSSMPSV